MPANFFPQTEALIVIDSLILYMYIISYNQMIPGCHKADKFARFVFIAISRGTLTIIMACQVFPNIPNFFMCLILEGFTGYTLSVFVLQSSTFQIICSPFLLLPNCKSNKPQTMFRYRPQHFVLIINAFSSSKIQINSRRRKNNI